MKKKVLVIILLAVLVVSCLALTACHEHEYESIVVKQATCTEAGLQQKVCECGESKSEIIPAKGHTEAIDSAVAPDCTDIGLTQGKHCSVCNEILVPQLTVDALGHSYVAVVTAPTCTEQGYTTHTCHCGDSYIDTYVDGSHTYKNKVCTICGELEPSAGLVYSSNGDCYAVTGIGTCTDISIVIPKKYNNKPVTRIGYAAFYACSSLTSITIPDSVTSIGDYAFYGCDSLTSITIPDSVTSIGLDAFSLTAYYKDTNNWQNKVLYIGNCLIEAETTIEECAIKAGTTRIASYAFYSRRSLKSITIPDSVTSIGASAFYDCDSLTSITIPFVGATLNGTSNTHFGYIFGASSYSYNEDYIPSSLKSVVITGGSSIGDYAFYDCDSLTSITIPDSVTSIGERAFAGCTGLTSITIPDSVTSIGSSAFIGCSLTSVTIGNSVTSIGQYAFYGCDSLTSITIPDSVTSIGSFAFCDCNSLTSVTFADPNGWYVTKTEGATSGTSLTLTDPAQNATFLKTTYRSYYWYKAN